MKHMMLVVLGFIALVVPAGRCADTGNSDFGVTSVLEAALLKEDWQKVADLLKDVNTAHPSPVLRLIKGHACLALNRNNESFSFFLRTQATNDLAQWKDWASKFESSHLGSVTPQYFKGDAYARMRQWDEAVKCFDKSLNLHKQHAMALNARGVVHALNREWDKAVTDLDDATKSDPRFADAYSSLGAMWIRKNDGAKGASKAFDKALQTSTNFHVALNGKACALLALGRWVEGDTLLKKCADLPNIGGVADVNLVFLNNTRLRVLSERLLKSANTNLLAGTTMNLDVRRAANELTEGMKTWSRPQVEAYVGDLFRKNPVTAARVVDIVSANSVDYVMGANSQAAQSFSQFGKQMGVAGYFQAGADTFKTHSSIAGAVTTVTWGPGAGKAVEAGELILAEGLQLKAASLRTGAQRALANGDSILKTIVNVNQNMPGLQSPFVRTYSMPETGNYGRDLAVGNSMAANARGAGKVVIVAVNPALGDTLKTTVSTKYGVPANKIEVVPASTWSGQVSPRDENQQIIPTCVLKVGGQQPGGVKIDLEDVFKDLPNWNVYTPFGLLYLETAIPTMTAKETNE